MVEEQEAEEEGAVTTMTTIAPREDAALATIATEVAPVAVAEDTAEGTRNAEDTVEGHPES